MVTPTNVDKKVVQDLFDWMDSKEMRRTAINIIGIRGASRVDWSSIPNVPDRWNDVITLVTDDGEVLTSMTATVEPGAHYTNNPLNPLGAFRLAANYQHRDGWGWGRHRNHEALVQVSDLFGYRDLNKNFQSEKSEEITIPAWCQVNIHGCNGRDGGESIGRWSAGCGVIRFWNSFVNFRRILKDSGRTRFDFTIVDRRTF